MECSGCKGDNMEDKIIENIKNFGWHAVYVFADEDNPPFLYTIGLEETFGHSELIIFGLTVEQSHAVVVPYIEKLIREDKKKIEPYSVDKTMNSAPVYFAPVEEKYISKYFGMAINHYSLFGRDFEAMQMIWPDTKNNFPFDEDFEDKFKGYQPILSEIDSKKIKR